MKAEITIKEGNKRPVNPLIFGHFIEYMRDCIDEGMWAQLLKNRSFEISEHVKDGVPDFWHRTGVKDAFHFEQDWDHTISREGCSLKITDRNHYDGYAGTAQTGLCIQNGRYEGYVWMKSEQEVPVSIEIYDKEGREFLSKTISVNGEWKKYCFDFTKCITIKYSNKARQQRLLKRCAKTSDIGTIRDSKLCCSHTGIDIGLDGISEDHVRMMLL